MQKMTRSPATPGRTGPQSYRSPELVTCARPLSKATAAAAAELAGIKMSKKFNIEFTRDRPIRTLKLKVSRQWAGSKIHKLHDQWCRDNGYPVRKPTSARARVRKTSSHKPRAQAGSLSPQAPRSGNQGTSVQAGPGHKQQG